MNMILQVKAIKYEMTLTLILIRKNIHHYIKAPPLSSNIKIESVKTNLNIIHNEEDNALK